MKLKCVSVKNFELSLKQLITLYSCMVHCLRTVLGWSEYLGSGYSDKGLHCACTCPSTVVKSGDGVVCACVHPCAILSISGVMSSEAIEWHRNS